jgi:hypothetical protein
VKFVLPIALLAALVAGGCASGSNGSAPKYLLLYPGSTAQTDFGGRCVEIENLSKGMVYLPMNSAAVFDTALDAFPGILSVKKCD